MRRAGSENGPANSGGESEVDESSLTGEPLPHHRAAGDRVLAGTVNGTGTLRVRVSTAAAGSVLARVSAQVDEPVETKAHRRYRTVTVARG